MKNELPHIMWLRKVSSRLGPACFYSGDQFAGDFFQRKPHPYCYKSGLFEFFVAWPWCSVFRSARGANNGHLPCVAILWITTRCSATKTTHLLSCLPHCVIQTLVLPLLLLFVITSNVIILHIFCSRESYIYNLSALRKIERGQMCVNIYMFVQWPIPGLH